VPAHRPEDAPTSRADHTPSFMDGLRSGLVAIVYGGRIALTGLGFALPFLVPAALAFGVYRWLRRRAAPAEQPQEL
jgi:hypothetical protein